MTRWWAAAVAGALVLLSGFSYCQSSKWHVERGKLIAAADSLRVQTRSDSVRAAALLAEANRQAALRETATIDAQRAIAEADRLRAQRATIRPVASSPALPPTGSDTVRALQETIVNLTEETVVLRAALDYNRNALQAAVVETGKLRAALTIETAAASTLRQGNADLTRMLKQAEPPCRLLLFRCPSRTTVMIGTAATVALGTLLVIR